MGSASWRLLQECIVGRVLFVTGSPAHRDCAEAEIVALVREIRLAGSTNPASVAIALSALRAILLPKSRISHERVALLGAAVRDELLGASANEWLQRLVVRGQP